MAASLDSLDRSILRELQVNARISNADLSRRVALSPSPCLRRVRALEANRLRDGTLQREILGALSGPAVVRERARGDREAGECSAETVDDLALHGSLLGRNVF